MGINQPMLLSEDPLQVSSDKERVQLLPKPEECTIGLNNLKQHPTDRRYHLTPTGQKANVTCFGCGEKGHYANKCPQRRLRPGQTRNSPGHPIYNMSSGILPTPMPHSMYPKSLYQQFPRQRPTQPWWKGHRKRKTSSLITCAELDLTKMGIEMGDLPAEVEQLQLWQPRWDGCCFSCGQFEHYAIDCTQGTMKNKKHHLHKSVWKRTKLKNHPKDF
uniref:CCHC-type domain-containing protein n=1 Tax=Oryza punctata TaxID=4537 RepID=A0A0E0LSN0_ORYPU